MRANPHRVNSTPLSQPIAATWHKKSPFLSNLPWNLLTRDRVHTIVVSWGRAILETARVATWNDSKITGNQTVIYEKTEMPMPPCSLGLSKTS